MLKKQGGGGAEWLEAIDPTVIVVGEAPSDELTYYDGYDTVTQNSAGDIVFDCLKGKTRAYASSSTYRWTF